MSSFSCPVCANSDQKIWAQRDGFQLYRCPNCTHLFVDMRSTELDYANAEGFRRHITNNLVNSDEAYYRHLCESERPGSHTWITTRLILAQVRRQQQGKGQNWMDVGSGSGYLLAQAQELGFKAVGVEPGGWGQLAGRYKDVSVIHGFLTPTTFQQRFEAISATDVLEHQPNPGRFLALLEHYLKPEGVIYLSFPFGACWRAKVLKSRWNMVLPPTHCQFFTRKSLRRLASQFHLNVVAEKTFNSNGFPGMSRLGLSLAAANRLLNILGWGDQMLVVLRRSGPVEGGA